MRKNIKRKKSRYIIYTLIIMACVCLAIGGYYIYVNNFKMPSLPPSVDKLIKEKAENNYDDKDDNKIDTSNYVNELPNFRSQYNNQNIVGRLEIPNLNINSLITRASNNEYYLNYNLYNQYDALGVPFFDYRNVDLLNGKQLNIYGHNTTNSKYYDQLPFINLEAYTDENIFNNYKDVYLSIDEKQKKYEVVAIKIIDGSNNEHMKVIFYNDEDYLNHVSKMLQNTLYKKNNLEINAKSNLLVLQVCHYNPPNTYLLVICKEII